MFKSKKTDTQTLLNWILACQQNEKEYEELITAEGLMVDPVASVKDIKLDWVPSGLANPNSYRN